MMIRVGSAETDNLYAFLVEKVVNTFSRILINCSPAKLQRRGLLQIIMDLFLVMSLVLFVGV